MSYDVHLTETFQKSVKALKKKCPHVKNDLLGQIKVLEADPSAGDPGIRRFGKSGSPVPM